MSSNNTAWITQNPEVEEIKRKALVIAKARVPVLITGENGTGKEVLANFIHNNSAPKEVVAIKPFVTVNCGAIPDDLIESELFGYEQGAFTGAEKTKEGAFELANGGTLFLDELGELSPRAQVKLLRAVEYQTFRRLGGKEEVKVDVRIISATNIILHDSIKSGDFREDLFYRLNVIELYVPALRHRRVDIPLLTDHFLKLFSEKYGIEKLYIEEECIRALKNYNWPGNVRELKNIIERCVVLSNNGRINKEILPNHISSQSAQLSENRQTNSESSANRNYIEVEIGTSLDEIEKKVIRQTLTSVNNNKSEAANILGFSRKTLHNKLQKYDTIH
ncbi:sigma-54 interaction domain-containing protein [Gracilimonas sp.]|uniref:sigma-54 interaction domain-containing protein n=1 Tax=Gracilimonas sp. TaxID=1974203 RepID=UPI003751304F